jgi:hypothetical protein
MLLFWGLMKLRMRLRLAGAAKPPGRLKALNVQHHTLNIDMAAKRHKKHKNQVSDLVISVGYNE